MRFAMIYGRWCSQIHGQFNIDGIYETQALTGSESSFFNLARGLSDLGHKVDVFCDVPAYIGNVKKLGGAHIYPVDTQIGDDYEAYLSWNEPDQLRRAPRGKLKLCAQQLNDFTYCAEGFDDFVDAYISPASKHGYYLSEVCGIPKHKVEIIGNSVNLEFYEGEYRRTPKSLAWCSSPDRGLHRLLEIYPLIRKNVPDVKLKIYYRVKEWFEKARGISGESGTRARYIMECLRRLGTDGENGITLVDAVANTQIAKELMATSLLPYTCDTIRFTEGFSVTILDACAAGCIPVITDEDAIGEIYGEVAYVIPGKPRAVSTTWINMISNLLEQSDSLDVRRENCKLFAKRFSREKIAKEWLDLIERKLENKHKPTVLITKNLYENESLDAAPKDMLPSDLLIICRRIWKQLLRHDEILQARKFLTSLPWQVRDNPEVAEWKKLVDAMLVHVDDPAEMKKLYDRYKDTVKEDIPMPEPIGEKTSLFPRWEFAKNHVMSLVLGRPPNVLDVGCMDGWLSNRLANDCGAQVFGVDGSEPCVKLARQKAEEFKTGAKFEQVFFEENFKGLKLPEDWPTFFDVIVLYEIYEHVRDPVVLLGLAKRYLAPGGTLLLSTPRGSWCQGIPVPYHEAWNLPRPREHIRAPILADVKQDLEESGFKVVQLKEISIESDIPGQASILASATR